MSVIDSPALLAQPNGSGLPGGEGASGLRLPRRIFIGQIVSPKSLTSLRMIKRGVLGVGSSGVIRFVVDLDEYEKQRDESLSARQQNLHPQPTPQRPAQKSPSAAAPSAVVDNLSEEDRSATPVNIPGRTADSDHLVNTASNLEESTLTLPPPVLDEQDANGSYLSEQYNKEQALIEEIVGSHGWRLQECETVLLNGNSFLCPGFIDTHIHAPQVPNLGRGQQYELLDWLENITFPRERKFEDPLYARRTYESVIQRMLDSGTTCAAIYATLHEEATMILAHICNEKGMRAFVGKCQMDRNAPVDYKEKSSATSMESTKRFINYCRNLTPYGAPDSTFTNDPLLSSGSVEMDESIARLSATMKSIMDESQARSASNVVPNQESITASSQSEQGEPSEREASPTAPINSPGATKAAKPNGLPMPAHANAAAVSMQRKASVTSRLSGASDSTRGHPASRHSASASISGQATPRRQKEVAEKYAHALVQPILTPRFAIACSDALLASISALMSRDGSLRVQTHLSENAVEIAFTKELFPFCETYTDVYDHFSLLTPRTILAHAIHLSESEMSLIEERKCGISHCPTSNLNLRSGASRLGELLNRGIKVGLGTDMSGGFGMSILTAIRDASIVAKVVQFASHNHPGSDDDGSTIKSSSDTQEPAPKSNGSGHGGKIDFCDGPLPVATLFYLATMGGAEVCSVQDRVGSLDEGKEFDAILFNCDNSNPNLYIEEDDDLAAKVEKVLFCADDRNIASVFVRGRVVGGSAPIA